MKSNQKRNLNCELRSKTINYLPEFLARLKNWQFFRGYLNLLPGIWVSAGIGFIFFHMKAAKAPDFHPVAPGKGICNLIEKHFHHQLGIFCRKPISSPQRLDNITPVHLPLFEICLKLVGKNFNFLPGKLILGDRFQDKTAASSFRYYPRVAR